MASLDVLFGSAGRVRILKLFLFNPGAVYTRKDVSRRTRLSPSSASAEIKALLRAGVIKQKVAVIDKRKKRGYALDEVFDLFVPLKNLLASDHMLGDAELKRRFRGAGAIKLLVAAGVFEQREGDRVDILVVGDGLKPTRIDSAIKTLEAETGRELIYALCRTEDFIYRMNAYDKFVRDIFDNPHKLIIDRIGISTSEDLPH